MATQEQIDLVKVNTLESQYPKFTDAEIQTILTECLDSVNFACYKICILKSEPNAVALGPISLESTAGFFTSLASMYHGLWQDEKAVAASGSVGGSVSLRRADESWD